jgi:ribosome-associated protein
MSKSERRPARKASAPRSTVSAPRTAAPRLPADVKLAVAAALDKKAIDVIVLDLRKGSAFTDYFLICTGGNVRQVKAIADAVDESFRKKGVKPALVEGYERGDWVLLDYFDFIVHIFTPATREFYSLERLWGDAERIEIPAK